MSINKENRLALANESLAMALKMVSRFEGGSVPTSEMTRIEDAANQAMQAASQLNQLVGILQEELSRN